MTEVTSPQSDLERLIPTEAIEELEYELTKYPANKRRSAVMAGLMIAQRCNNGYLSEELMNAVADYLGIPHVAAYEVATFYTMYNLKPVGEHVINVCTNISCMLRGSDKVMAHLEDRLAIKVGETTPDNKFTLFEVECAGACKDAPMFEMDEVYFENLTPEKIDQILDDALAKNGGE
ncbi:MAG: NAD(P)H-dependent oxidoreductase subunit E [Enterobacterales bacterium]|nr:NAD(P)H-dependent oxidoreductase subunit E [Enterobacterales bacterium]